MDLPLYRLIEPWGCSKTPQSLFFTQACSSQGVTLSQGLPLHEGLLFARTCSSWGFSSSWGILAKFISGNFIRVLLVFVLMIFFPHANYGSQSKVIQCARGCQIIYSSTTKDVQKVSGETTSPYSYCSTKGAPNMIPSDSDQFVEGSSPLFDQGRAFSSYPFSQVSPSHNVSYVVLFYRCDHGSFPRWVGRLSKSSS